MSTGLFPAYLDASATAPLRPEAREAMLAVWDGGPGNASSVHSFGHRARTVVDESRAALAAAFGVRPSEIVFTSGGTEANNLAVIGAALARPRGRHIVTTPLEHPSVLESCRFLERVHGFEVSLVPADGSGLVSVADAVSLVRPDTTLVSIGLANAEIGTVQPVGEIPAALASAFPGTGAVPGDRPLFHIDAVQAAASLPVSLAKGAWPGAGVDLMTVAAHKFGGPQGVGALIVRRGIPLEPLLHGGGQERGARSGTENVAGIAGFAAAVTALHRDGVGTRAVALASSRDALVGRMLARVRGAQLTGHPSERLPGHASFVIAGVSGESVLVALDAAGFAVSSGSACAAGSDEPSPVLIAIGVDPDVARTAIRFSLSAPLDLSVLDRLVDIVAREVGE
ncbi:cysteine desulfurase IscS [Leucobacter sp. Psy1]|uniref:cysteine desulfurase family protein n=1 Tax=Leucobacter sp. Psy1 TaxID=2875729 RepID=UPI001CD588B1|nr:cysteine desulfurase family protein [Leucobacter sp. Psy1]UBH05285.1 cysteine desulfurase IscS [Leucobacter sp. Psy1]